MRRWTTAIVVGGVVLLAALAAADSFRGPSKERVVQPTTSTIHPRGRPTLGGTLRRDQISGQLIYSDPLCNLKVILLPSLERAPVLAENGAQLTGCSFSYAAGHFLRGKVATTRDGATIARCSENLVTIRNVVSGSVLARTRGCPAAWRTFPDGRTQLTHVRDGEIVSGKQVLVSRKQLLAAARKHPSLVGLSGDIPLHVAVPEFAWLDEERFVAVLNVSAPEIVSERMLVLLNDGRLTGISVLFGGLIQHIVVSSSRLYAAVEPGTLMRIDGASWALPRTLGILHVLAFSADDHWLAVGTRASVFLLSVDDIAAGLQSPRIVRIPVIASDLVWEAGGVVPTAPTVG